jgi:hypothetical protein
VPIVKLKITVTKILFSIDGTFCLRIDCRNNALAGIVSILLLSSFYFEDNIISTPIMVYTGKGISKKILLCNKSACNKHFKGVMILNR